MAVLHEDDNSIMEYVDDGDSEAEVLGPVQESHQILQDATSQSDQPADLPPSHHRSRDNAESSTVRSDDEQDALDAQDQSDAAGRLPIPVQSATIAAPPAVPPLITSESGSAPATASLFNRPSGSALITSIPPSVSLFSESVFNTGTSRSTTRRLPFLPHPPFSPSRNYYGGDAHAPRGRGRGIRGQGWQHGGGTGRGRGRGHYRPTPYSTMESLTKVTSGGSIPDIVKLSYVIHVHKCDTVNYFQPPRPPVSDN